MATPKPPSTAFAHESGAIQEESQLKMNAVDNPSKFISDIKNGRWDSVLPQLSDLKLTSKTLINIYEQIVLELIEMKEFQLAKAILRDNEDDAIKIFKEEETNRFVRLEKLFSTASFEPIEAYQGSTKEERRSQVASEIEAELEAASPSRLTSLINQALRWQIHNGLLSVDQEYDLFKGEVMTHFFEVEAPPAQFSGQIEFSKKSHPDAIAFSPDGQHLVTGSNDGFIEVWNFVTLKIRKDLVYQAQDKFMSHKESILALSFSSDSEMLASGSADGMIKVWQLKTGKPLRKYTDSHQKGVTHVCFSKDNAKLLSCSFDGTAKILGLKSGNILSVLRGHTSFVNHALWLPADKNKAVTASSDGTVILWNTKSGECLRVIQPGHGALSEASIFRVFAVPRGSPPHFYDDRFLVCNQSPILSVVSLSGEILASYSSATDDNPKGADFVNCVLSPKSEWIFGLTESGKLFSFRFNNPDPISTLQLHERDIGLICNHPFRNLLASYGDGGKLVLWKP